MEKNTLFGKVKINEGDSLTYIKNSKSVAEITTKKSLFPHIKNLLENGNIKSDKYSYLEFLLGNYSDFKNSKIIIDQFDDMIKSEIDINSDGKIDYTCFINKNEFEIKTDSYTLNFVLNNEKAERVTLKTGDKEYITKLNLKDSYRKSFSEFNKSYKNKNLSLEEVLDGPIEESSISSKSLEEIKTNINSNYKEIKSLYESVLKNQKQLSSLIKAKNPELQQKINQISAKIQTLDNIFPRLDSLYNNQINLLNKIEKIKKIEKIEKIESKTIKTDNKILKQLYKKISKNNTLINNLEKSFYKNYPKTYVFSTQEKKPLNQNSQFNYTEGVFWTSIGLSAILFAYTLYSIFKPTNFKPTNLILQNNKSPSSGDSTKKINIPNFHSDLIERRLYNDIHSLIIGHVEKKECPNEENKYNTMNNLEKNLSITLSKLLDEIKPSKFYEESKFSYFEPDDYGLFISQRTNHLKQKVAEFFMKNSNGEFKQEVAVIVENYLINNYLNHLLEYEKGVLFPEENTIVILDEEINTNLENKLNQFESSENYNIIEEAKEIDSEIQKDEIEKDKLYQDEISQNNSYSESKEKKDQNYIENQEKPDRKTMLPIKVDEVLDKTGKFEDQVNLDKTGKFEDQVNLDKTGKFEDKINQETDIFEDKKTGKYQIQYSNQESSKFENIDQSNNVESNKANSKLNKIAPNETVMENFNPVKASDHLEETFNQYEENRKTNPNPTIIKKEIELPKSEDEIRNIYSDYFVNLFKEFKGILGKEEGVPKETYENIVKIWKKEKLDTEIFAKEVDKKLCYNIMNNMWTFSENDYNLMIREMNTQVKKDYDLSITNDQIDYIEKYYPKYLSSVEPLVKSKDVQASILSIFNKNDYQNFILEYSQFLRSIWILKDFFEYKDFNEITKRKQGKSISKELFKGFSEYSANHFYN